MPFAVFVVALIVVTAGWHRYVWGRLVRDVTLPGARARRVGAVVLALLEVATVLAILRPRWLGGPIQTVVCAVGFPWIGFCILLACALLVTELWRAGGSAGRALLRRPPPDEARRRALSQVLGGAAVAAGGAAALVGVAEALNLVLERVRVPLARLPEAMSGTRIVQITDVHLGSATGPEYLARVVAEVNALAPDLIAITGDLVDGSVDRLRPHVALLRGLRARYGVFFVTGNHEFYSGAPAWAAHLATLGVRVLRNERVSIGDAEASFDLAGVDDWNASHYADEHGHDLPAAVAGRDPARELVLLAHQPRSLYEAALHGVGLQLSGHTHGGQLFPLRPLLYFDQPFLDGLHRRGETWIYVSRGTGYWGPPMRVGARPEITEITLVRA
jgi:hypothetical protein